MSTTRLGLEPRPNDLQNDPCRAPPIVGEVLRSAGAPLQGSTRLRMEQRFGADFSQVRVHTDARAAQSATAVDAQAYTVGRDLVFGAGRYAPQSPGGEQLLAHELAHVLQQRATVPGPAADLRIGAPHDPLEAAADRRAHAALAGPGSGHSPAEAAAASSTAAPVANVLQRQPVSPLAQPAKPPIPLVPALTLPSASIEIAANEAISSEHPLLVDLAARFKRADAGGAPARVEIASDLSQDAKLSSAKEQAEREQLVARMAQTRTALVALGVPNAQIDMSAPTAYSTRAHGQIGVTVRQNAGIQAGPIGPPKPGAAVVPAAPAATAPGLADALKLQFGPVTVELPKSIKTKLPIKLSAAKSLVIELSAATPAKFDFKMTLDGTPHLRVSASAGVAYDSDKKLSTGAAGLQIESVKTVCQAVNPEVTRAALTAAGVKLTKASQDYSAAPTRESELSSLADIAGALGEMYEAVDKAKAACTQVPRWKLDFGVSGPLNPDAPTETTPSPPSTFGGTLTIPF